MAQTTKVTYSDEQIAILERNPYTYRVSQHTLHFTLEFKEYFVDQVKKGEMTTRKIFESAGYTPDLIPVQRMKHMRRHILMQAQSSKGLQPPRGMTTEEKRKHFKNTDLTKKRQETAIMELQEKVVKLEAEISFLKKISSLYMKEYQKENE